MNWEPVVIAVIGAVIGGFLLGLILAYAVKNFRARASRELALEIFRETEEQRRASIEAVIDQVRAQFAGLSLEALAKSTDEFLKLAKARLDSERDLSARDLESKKILIDRQLERISSEMEKVANIVTDLEKDRIEKFGQLSHQLRAAGEQTAALTQTANALREALASSKVRGQWGERMAEDVLRIAGFIENVNYVKQTSLEAGGSRPDFTFLLPRDLKLNMDVKFPLDNYIRYLETDSEMERGRFRDIFLRNVRDKIKEITTRNYINAEDHTVDYALLFIPNEHVYSFIHDQDSTLLDEGIRNKVIFCSPLTLFAILAVIRQAVDNFAVENTTKEILALMGAFREQWTKFLEQMDKLGKRIGDAQKEYEALVTTRKRGLERPLGRIDSLRTREGIQAVADSGTGEAAGGIKEDQNADTDEQPA